MERDAILDVRTHFKPTETFQYTHFGSCHPQGVKKGFIKGEALRLLRTNSSKIIFEEKITNFKAHLLQRGYPEDLINTTLSEVNFKDRKLVLQQKPRVLQGFTGGYKQLHGVTASYEGLQGITKDYRKLVLKLERAQIVFLCQNNDNQALFTVSLH